MAGKLVSFDPKTTKNIYLIAKICKVGYVTHAASSCCTDRAAPERLQQPVLLRPGRKEPIGPGPC